MGQLGAQVGAMTGAIESLQQGDSFPALGQRTFEVALGGLEFGERELQFGFGGGVVAEARECGSTEVDP